MYLCNSNSLTRITSDLLLFFAGAVDNELADVFGWVGASGGDGVGGGRYGIGDGSRVELIVDAKSLSE